MINLSGYTLTFDDEFNTRSISQAAGATTWGDIRTQDRADANSDVGFGSSSFVDAGSGYDPFRVSNGALTITAVQPGHTTSGVPGAWSSGLITTQGNFSQTYGYFEVRADFSQQVGAWNAFWLLPNQQTPDPNNAGHHQELDVVEQYGNGPNSIYSGIHTTDPAPNQNWQRDLQVVSQVNKPGGYHTYGVDWQPDTISFYVDGQMVGSKATPSDMHNPMYILANLAVQTTPGGNNANAANVPLSSSIDYIRAYSNAPNAVAVAQGTVSAPDGKDPGLYGAAAANVAPAGSTNASGGTTLGTGPDKLVLHISEDAYRGDAQYTVAVDGHQVGGVQTAHAVHGSGQTEAVLVQGDWAAGDHTVTLTFLNDAWDGTAATDRNLYLDNASYNGTGVSGSSLSLLSQGGQTFNFHDAGTTQTGSSTGTGGSSTGTGGTSTGTPAAGSNGTSGSTPASTPVSTPVNTTLGTGPDKLVLHISEDAYRGDAQYTVAVDGHQVGGVQTAHAVHGSGQSDAVLVQGDWGAGDHTVTLTFLNDAWDGTTATDRNLYLDNASYNGTGVSGSSLSLMSQGGQTFNFHDAGAAQASPGSGAATSNTSGTSTTGTSTGTPAAASTGTSSNASAGTPASAPVTTTLGTGPDKLMLHISEDAYRGDAQYTVAVDGQQVGGVQSAHASHASGQSDAVLLQGNWGAGNHTVTITYLNDAWDGTAATDRNLYLDSASYNGAEVANASVHMLGQGAYSLPFHN